MTDDQLRALVRETVARHLGVARDANLGVSQGAVSPASAPAVVATSVVVLRDASHYRYATLHSGDDEDGPCFIEPSVRCNHCGYCQSHGH